MIDQTFELIHSLTPNEKRFFRLQSGEGKNYLHVFDAMDNMSEYDLEILKKKLKKRKLNISYEKNYLHTQLLKSLRAYHAESTVKTRARANLDYIEILVQKGLLQQALKLLKKNESIFDLYELFPYSVALHECEEAILHRSDGLSDQHFNEQFYKRRKELLLRNLNLVDYREVERRLINLNMENQFIANSEEFQKIKQHELILNNKALSFDAEFRYYQVHAMIALYEYDYPKESFCFKAIIDLINAHPHFKEAYYKVYYNVALHNYINACLLSLNYDEAEKTITELKALNIEFEGKNEDVFCFSYVDELSLYIQRGDALKAAKIIPEVMSGMDKLKHISVYNRSLLNYNIAVAYFMGAQYKEAVKVLLNLIEEMRAVEYKDRQAFSRVLLLVCYYAQCKFDKIEYQLNSTKRFFKSNDRYFKSEKVLLEFFKGVTKNNKAKIGELEKLRLALVNIFKDREEATLLFLFDFISWIESEIKGKSFASVVAAKLLK